MRTLVAIPHFFSPKADAVNSSSDARRAERRREAVLANLTAWARDLAGPHAMTNFDTGVPYKINKKVRDITVVLVTANHRTLIDADACGPLGVSIVNFALNDPKKLGFRCAAILADNSDHYDTFILCEDDLLVRDTLFLDKVRWFQSEFGYKRLLMPSRFEPAIDQSYGKTFIDGDVDPRQQDRWLAALPDDEYLSALCLGVSRSFMRAKNPHAGLFVLTREQMKFWMGRPHWMDEDCSFVGPLESAATLGVLKTFSIYKGFGPSIDFLSVEHADNRYSSVLAESDYPHQRLIK